MADEEKNEETPANDPAPTDASQPDTAAAEGEAVADDAKAEDATPEKEDSSTDSPPAETEGTDPAPTSEAAPAGPGGGAEEPAAGGDEDELSWKARRRLERSRQPHEAKPQRTPEEKAAERAAKRAANVAERRRYRQGRKAKAEKGTGTPPAEKTSVARKVRRGTVVSSKADKTITVRIDVARRHPAYEKIVRHSSTLHAHDERNEATEGDLVQVVETRPMSRLKRWRLTEVLEKAK